MVMALNVDMSNTDEISRKITLCLSLFRECHVSFFVAVGHRDYQHGHSDRTHCGHSCQNGLD